MLVQLQFRRYSLLLLVIRYDEEFYLIKGKYFRKKKKRFYFILNLYEYSYEIEQLDNQHLI